MMDQYGNTYLVPYHDPDYLSGEGYYQQHYQPIVQYVPVKYSYGPMTENEQYHHYQGEDTIVEDRRNLYKDAHGENDVNGDSESSDDSNSSSSDSDIDDAEFNAGIDDIFSHVDSAILQELKGMFGQNGFFLENDESFDSSEYYANSLANYY